MAYEENLKCITLRAPSTAYSTYQYRMVKADSTEGYWAVGSTKSAASFTKGPVGVLQDAPTVAGEACAIAVMGSGCVSKLVCGSTKLSPGKYFIMGALGKAQSTASQVAQEIIMGPWLSAAGSTDSIGSAVLSIVGICT